MAKQAKRQLAGSGEALPAGVIGETMQSVVELAAAASNAGATLGTLNIPPGVWLIQVACTVINSAGTISAGVFAGVPTTNSALNPTDVGVGYSLIEAGGYTQALTFPASNTVRTNASNNFVANITSSTSYYHRVSWTSTGGGSVGLRGYIRATRIA